MDLASFSLLGLELHRGLKAIHIHAQCPVEFRELPVRQFSDKAIIANHLPHNLSVLLLDVTLIIASSWAPSGKGDLLLFTKGEQLDIDELRSIIRVNAQDGERKQPTLVKREPAASHRCDWQLSTPDARPAELPVRSVVDVDA